MKFEKLSIPDVILIHPMVFEDNRGFFLETYKKSEFYENGIMYEFIQDNHAKSHKNVFRGLHYQLSPEAQGKLIRVTRGSVIDFAVDIRKESSSYGKYVSAHLSAESKKMLWIPPGFAHGYLTLEDNTEFQYKTTAQYAPLFERGIKFDDVEISLELPVSKEDLILAEKDKVLPALKDAENNF
ncbi:MAG: dTDP-4-dehydrorhamnose 3,5-epimerase [Spirochaetia bacterium]|nr:dTDP-4-dehydrorhamnose 3,5-epimerase [Spirochaetia bacterium]